MKEKITMLELINNSNKFDVYLSPNYEFTKKNSPLLNEPRFTIKLSQAFVEGLTYRKVNDWDSKDLISGSRENKEAGWRKFSVVDIVRLSIISDLRKFGFSTEKIQNIMHRILKNSFEAIDSKTNDKRVVPFLQLEYSIFSCLNGDKILLLVDANEGVFMSTEKDVMDCYFSFDKASSPCLILPFFSYVKKIATQVKINPDTTMKQIFDTEPTLKEKEILKIIRNKNYQEIRIVKPNEEEFRIEAKSRKSGLLSDEEIMSIINKGDYQKVTVVTDKGQKVALIHEENIRV